MLCEVLNWRDWIAENTKAIGGILNQASIIHTRLLYHVLPDDDGEDSQQVSNAECDWCVGEWLGNHTRFSSPSQPPATQGRSHLLQSSPSSSASWILFLLALVDSVSFATSFTKTHQRWRYHLHINCLHCLYCLHCSDCLRCLQCLHDLHSGICAYVRIYVATYIATWLGCYGNMAIWVYGFRSKKWEGVDYENG